MTTCVSILTWLFQLPRTARILIAMHNLINAAARLLVDTDTATLHELDADARRRLHVLLDIVEAGVAGLVWLYAQQRNGHHHRCNQPMKRPLPLVHAPSIEALVIRALGLLKRMHRLDEHSARLAARLRADELESLTAPHHAAAISHVSAHPRESGDLSETGGLPLPRALELSG